MKKASRAQNFTPENRMKNLFLSLLMLVGHLAMAAGTVSTSTTYLTYSNTVGVVRYGHKVSVSWVADASDGSVPSTSLSLKGLVTKAVTNPGATAPTDQYDLACGDPADSALDVFAGALGNRHTTNTEQVYTVVTGATVPVLVDTCTLQLTNNSVNSATGTIDFYVLIP